MRVRIFICSKCFNSGGTLLNKGTHREPWYVHYPGQCQEFNDRVRNEIYARNYPGFWLFLTNVGVDFDREELCGK